MQTLMPQSSGMKQGEKHRRRQTHGEVRFFCSRHARRSCVNCLLRHCKISQHEENFPSCSEHKGFNHTFNHAAPIWVQC